VAWLTRTGELVKNTGEFFHWMVHWTPIYTTPPQGEARGLSQQQRKPLTDEQFQAICNSLSRQGGWDGDGWDLALKEVIEAAHGIKE
jgi:hypothetical protein